MTTDNKTLLLDFLMKVILLTVLTFAVVALLSCSEGNGDKYKYDHIFEDIEGNSSTNPTEDDLKYYYDVIVPSDVSAEIYEKATTLSDELSQKTRAFCDVYYEYEMPLLSAQRTHIYIGNLQLQSCRRFYKDFRTNDYGYCYSDGVVLVGGVTDTGTCEAIDRFISDILPKVSLEGIMNDQDQFIYRADYSSGEVKLNGFPLSEYTLVYPIGDTDAFAFANLISEKIEDTLEYSLAVCSEDECDQKARSICIGRTARAGTKDILCTEIEAKLLPYDTGVSIVSESSFGMEIAFERLYELLLDSSESVLIEDEISITFDADNVHLMCLSFYEPVLNLSNILKISADIRDLDADVIRLDGLSDAYFDYIKRNLANTHSAYTVRSGEGESIHYLYPKSDRSFERGNISCGEIMLDSIYLSENEGAIELVISELNFSSKADVQSVVALGAELSDLEFDRFLIFGRLYSDIEAAFLDSLKGVRRVYDEKLGIDMYVSGRTVTVGEVTTRKLQLFDLVSIEITYFSE